MARNNGVFYFTVVLIVVTSGLFFAFDCPYLYEEVSPAVPFIAAWLFIFVMSTLLRTAFSDPGIVPRASAEEAAYIEKTLETPSQDPQTYRPPPRVKEITINGQTVKLKFCFTCKIFRPPRASHCSMCDNCVERFDHHCPWFGNCVGKRNYKFFFMFLVSLSIYCCYLFAFVVTHLVMLSKGENNTFISAMKQSPASILEAIICFFSVWSIVGLTGFHGYLVSSNQTTNEDIKGSFSSRSGQGNFNPYSEGSMLQNCAAVLCGPLHPSLINRRGLIIPEPPESDKYGAVRTTTAPMSPTQLGSKNGVTYDSSRTDEKQKLESSVQQQDSLQADSERGLVKLSSV